MLSTMPGFPLEHLAAVPVEMLWLRPPVGMLGLLNRLTVMSHKGFLETRRTVRLVGDE